MALSNDQMSIDGIEEMRVKDFAWGHDTVTVSEVEGSNS